MLKQVLQYAINSLHALNETEINPNQFFMDSVSEDYATTVFLISISIAVTLGLVVGGLIFRDYYSLDDLKRAQQRHLPARSIVPSNGRGG